MPETTPFFTVGCFALNTPFAKLQDQLAQIQRWGFRWADITDNSDGACLGVEFGFTALASLDANPFDLLRLFGRCEIGISAWCAHANLLDPTAPWRFGTAQIIKAVRGASAIGVPCVITTEGEPESAFGRGLSRQEAVLLIREKLDEPLRVAADHGVKLLLEPHGPLTGSLDAMEELVERLDTPAFGLNLDTGNFWLAGGDPVEFVRRFGSRIHHVHWKDMPAEMEAKRGESFGCGMAAIPLGEGVVDIASVIEELRRAGFSGHTTLEVAGEGAVLGSRDFLLGRGGKI